MSRLNEGLIAGVCSKAPPSRTLILRSNKKRKSCFNTKKNGVALWYVCDAHIYLVTHLSRQWYLGEVVHGIRAYDLVCTNIEAQLRSLESRTPGRSERAEGVPQPIYDVTYTG